MAELLGIGITDFPRLHMNEPLSMPLKNAIEKGEYMLPEMKDPANWPEPMRIEWGEDEGLTSSGPARQRQIDNFRKVRAILDEFKPDFIVIWSKDHLESLQNYAVPPFWIQAHEQIVMKPYDGRQSFFGDDPNTEVTVRGHREGALHLVRALQREKLSPVYSLQSMHPNGIAHTFRGAIVHLDWDRRAYDTPVVPFAIDPFGPRDRRPEGMAPLTKNHLYPISAPQAFELGRATARALQDSPWRVALVAATGWSHTQNTSWERGWVHPHMPGDRRRYAELAENRFDTWHNFTYEEFEEYGQWEHLCWIPLAGAMTEIGSQVTYSDYQENYCFNSNWVTVIFSVK